MIAGSAPAFVQRLPRTIREAPSAVLFLAQMLGLVIYPFFDAPTRSGTVRSVGQSVVSVFGVLVLLLAVRTVRSTPALSWVAWAIGAPVVALTLIQAFAVESVAIAFASALLHAMFYAYTTYALVRYMFADDHIGPDEWWAVAATFTVLAWGFTYAYQALQIVVPGAFGAGDGSGLRTWMELLFMSVACLTGVGLSDVGPALPAGRSLVIMEQIGGMLYVALVISRLVTLAAARSRAARASIEPDEVDGDR